MVLAKETKAKNLIKSGFQLVIFQTLYSKYFFAFMKIWKIYSTKAIISENHCIAPEGKWAPSGGTEIPFNYELFGPKIHKNFVGEKIESNEC